jgi:hypothetical protein
MKTTFLMIAFAAVATAADQVPTPRITAAELTKLQQQQAPMRNLQRPVAAGAPMVRAEKPSLVKQSTILHDGRSWTLVPNGAVVYLPQSLGNRVNAKPVGTLLSWSDFFVKNRAWITTNDVSFNQAAGKEAIPPARVAFWAQQDKVVVAIHQGGPISVRLAQPDSSLQP